MIAVLLIDAILIALAFLIFWKLLGGEKLYRNLTFDEARDLERQIEELDERLAGLPTDEQAGTTSPAVNFLRGELERDRRKLEHRLHRVVREAH
jgi:hypothetical protein